MNHKVEEYFNNVNQEQIEIFYQIRQLIMDTDKEITEEIKWGFPVYSKIKNFCYLRSNKNHITLGFYNIEKLIDPDNLLEGEGNTLRHIKLKKIGSNKPLTKLIGNGSFFQKLKIN